MSTKSPLPVPQQEPENESYYAWGKRKSGEKWENWKPWLEDVYLRWTGKDNKASYTTKGMSPVPFSGVKPLTPHPPTDTLDKSKVTGVEQIDTAQDGVNNLVAGQLGRGGLAQPLGDAVSRDGISRAERRGADDKGNYAPGPLNSVAKPVAEGAKGAGGYVGGLFGGKK
jgi:hypothetical protein